MFSNDCITLWRPNSCCGRALVGCTSTSPPLLLRRCCLPSLRSRPDPRRGRNVRCASTVLALPTWFSRRQCWPLLREGLALEAAPLLARRPVRREETPQVIGAEPHAPALAPAAHFIGVRALAVARDAQRQAVALPTWFSRRHCRHKDKQKESAFLRAGEVEVKREREKERKRERERETKIKRDIQKDRKLLVAPREFQLLKPGGRCRRGLRTSGRHETRLDSSSRSAPPDLDRKRKCLDVCFMPPKTRLRPLVPVTQSGAQLIRSEVLVTPRVHCASHAVVDSPRSATFHLALATSHLVLAADILLVQREASSLSLCLSFSLSRVLFLSFSLSLLTSTSPARRKALSFCLSLSLSGPVGLTARLR